MPDPMARCSQVVQASFYGSFFKWGHFVARRPCLVIWVTVLLAIALSARLLMVFSNPLPSEVEQDKLWVPQNAPSIDSKERYDSIFSNAFRRTTLIFTTNPPGNNVLTKSVLEEVRRFDIMATEDLHVWGGETSRSGRSPLALGNVSYEDVCAKSSMSFGGNDTDIPNCILFGHPLELWYRVGGIFDFDFTDAENAALVDSGRGIDPQIFPASSNRTVAVDSIFGGIERDAAGHVTGAKAIMLSYLLQEHAADTDERNAAIAWEDQLNLAIGHRWTDADDAGESPYSEGSASPVGGMSFASDVVQIFPQTAGATSRELGKNIRGDLVSIQISYFIIFIYAVFIFGRMQPTHSRSLLAAAGVVSVALSIAVAYGFSSLFVKLNPVVNVLPFILIGIGVDDMFVLLHALEATPSELSVPERLGRTMGTAGVSITITSITDLFAFLLGTTSQLPALSGFCTFAAIGILADYLLQISFFAGWMALDAYREKEKKIDCCPCCCPPTTIETGCCCCCYGSCASLPPYGLRPFIKKYYIPLLRPKPVKAIILLAFAALTGASAYGASQLKQDFQFRWFVNDDAPLQDAFDMQDAYYSATGLPVYFVTPPSSETSYPSLASQQKLLDLEAEIEANEFIEAGSLSAWYPLFREWIHSCGETVTVMGSSCVKRDCTITYDGGEVRKVYPYCTTKKVQRSASGDALTESLVYSGTAVDLELPGAAEAKLLVLTDGTAASDDTPIEETRVPETAFYEWLDQFVEDAPLGAIVATEIIWVSDADVRTPSQVAEGLTATRMRATYVATSGAQENVRSMTSVRASVASADFGSTFPYMSLYLYYEQYAIIRGEAIANLSLAFAAVIAITLIMIASFGATLLVGLCIILVDVDILGLMYFWGLSLDSVAVIDLVLAIGLALDYAVHIAHAFMHAKGDKQKRVDIALEEMGVPVIHGLISTFLAVVVLSASQSYIFRIFFKMFFGIVVFGGAHGLIFLPTVLSLIGPDTVDIDDTKKNFEEMPTKGSSTVSESVPTVYATPSSASAPPSPPGSELGSQRSSRVSPIEPARCEA